MSAAPSLRQTEQDAARERRQRAEQHRYIAGMYRDVAYGWRTVREPRHAARCERRAELLELEALRIGMAS